MNLVEVNRLQVQCINPSLSWTKTQLKDLAHKCRAGQDEHKDSAKHRQAAENVSEHNS